MGAFRAAPAATSRQLAVTRAHAVIYTHERARFLSNREPDRRPGHHFLCPDPEAPDPGPDLRAGDRRRLDPAPETDVRFLVLGHADHRPLQGTANPGPCAHQPAASA